MGATAMTEAAESLAQKRPSGLENEAMRAVRGGRVGGGQVDAPEGFVPGKDDGEEEGRGEGAGAEWQ